MAIIAKIKLAHGQVGYYDDYSKIYLTPSKPEAYIVSGTNLYQIKKSIKSGRLKLIEGSLTDEPKIQEIKTETAAKNTSRTKEKKAVKAESPITPKVEVEVVEEAGPAEAEKPKRSRRKKNVEPAAVSVEEAAETEILEEIPIE